MPKDVLIVVVSNQRQQEFWKTTLHQDIHRILPSSTLALVVQEEWEGGAGNGLGTLYAFQQAFQLAETQGIDLFKLLEQGGSVSLYHTAGKGMRLFPLCGVDYNDKSAIKLPFRKGLITLLEASILQTTPQRQAGRLSIFWGDQLFSADPVPSPKKALLTIFSRVIPFPNSAEWETRHLNQYGVLARGSSGHVQLLDKLDYSTFQTLIDGLDHKAGLGISFGSFTLSPFLLKALLEEFAEELSSRSSRLDSDPHFWMPLTLEEPLYLRLMQARGMAQKKASSHYLRMQKLKKQLSPQPLLEIAPAGAQYWWDYGSVAHYFRNVRMLLEKTEEGEAMRKFFQIPEQPSLIHGCHLGQATIENSILVNVSAEKAHISNSILINVQAQQIEAEESLAYHVEEKGALHLQKDAVRADAACKMLSSLTRDGKKDWSLRLPGNALSYEELWELNQSTQESSV